MNKMNLFKNLGLLIVPVISFTVCLILWIVTQSIVNMILFFVVLLFVIIELTCIIYQHVKTNKDNDISNINEENNILKENIDINE